MIGLFIATNNTGEVTRTAYWEGFDAYCDKQPLEDMPTPEHVRGWFFANKCDSDTWHLSVCLPRGAPFRARYIQMRIRGEKQTT